MPHGNHDRAPPRIMAAKPRLANDSEEGPSRLVVRHLGLRDYLPVVRTMQAFTEGRTPTTADEFWCLQHPPVFTQGLAGKPEHLLDAGNIPVVQTDRGGQITYHGPGQLVIYLLVDMRRAGLGPRAMVNLMEDAVVSLLAEYDIEGSSRPDAPGVYVGGAKIASLGLRIRRGCSYHGLSLNVDMDLRPFQRINPCGYPGLAMTQVSEMRPDCSVREIEQRILHNMVSRMAYVSLSHATNLPKS